MHLLTSVTRALGLANKTAEPFASYALDELDRRLSAYVKTKNGFFIEAGANDGLTQSNTLYFERHFGWSGLLIEPIPELYQQCRLNRSACLHENAALVPIGYPLRSISMKYCNLMSLVDGAMKSPEMDAKHIATGAAVQNVLPYEIDVPAKSLSEILAFHHVTHVDLLSLDVEGYEAAALQGIEFDKVAPSFILVEARFPKDVEQVLLPNGYSIVARLSHHDILYYRV